MPAAPVYWLTVQKRFDDLVVATYGRGDYILDDLTPLREYDKARAAGGVVLFNPRPAYRFRQIASGRLSEPGTRVIGQNPPYGADINFYLTAPDSAVTVTFAGSDGKAIRTLHLRGRTGINRVWWDLRGEDGKMPHMLVPPPDAPWVPNGPEGYHILTGIMIPNVVRGPLVIPGSYTATLTAGGKTSTAQLQVLPDPHSLGTPASIAAEAGFQQQVVGEVNQVSDMIEKLEQVRQRVATIEGRVANDPKEKAVLDAAKKLADRAMEIEGKLIDIWLTDGHEDLNRHPSQLYQKLTALYTNERADLGPTAADLEVNRYFQQWMADSKAALDAFVAKDVPAFDAVLRAHHLSLTP